MLAYWLLGLAPVLAIAYIVWTHKKKAAARAAVSSKRFDAIFGGAAQRAATPTSTAGAAESPAAQPSSAAALGRRTPIYSRKERLLEEAHALLFSRLRSALPEHELFAHVSLAAAVEVPPAVQGREREQRLRALRQYTADCMVCSRDMTVIAAVDLEGDNNVERQFKSECLKTAGVRYVRISSGDLAKCEGLRALVLGESG